jgi:zinc D-Ala-D-Ala carboxypeptidase
MSRIQLSKNFFLDEFMRSEAAARHGIVVEPDSQVFANLQRLCETVLQPLRDALGAVTVLSGYRPPEVNRLVGGAPTSQHIQGLSGDVLVAGYTPLQVCQWVRDNLQSYDQVIHEFGQWAHVSAPPLGGPVRLQELTAVKTTPVLGIRRTVYVPGLHDMAEATRRAA